MLRQIARQLIKTVETKNFASARSLCTTNQLLKDDDKTAAKTAAEPAPAERTVLVEKDENITLIGINRPQIRNAINASTAAALCDAFSAFEADDNSYVAVLYGVGGSFCAGYDIIALGADEQVSIDILMAQEGSVGPTRRRISKPVVCGINGYCVANGLELALMCDLRVMEETAVLGFFNRRFGVPLIDGGSARLPAIVGFSRALDLVLTGRSVCAEEAEQIGIANRVVPVGTSLCKAVELAKQLASFPQGALNHDRNSLYSAVFEGNTFNQAVQNEIMYTSKNIIDQMQNGIKWFNQKFKTHEATKAWYQRDKSMADWDDVEVAEEAAKKIEIDRKERHKLAEEEKQQKLDKKKKPDEEKKPEAQKASEKEKPEEKEKPK